MAPGPKPPGAFFAKAATVGGKENAFAAIFKDLATWERHVMTKRSSRTTGNKHGQSKKATPGEKAASSSVNRDALRKNARFKARQGSLGHGSKGGREEMGNTERASREASRRKAPKLAATEATGLPRQIAEKTVLNEAYLGVPSQVVRSADIGATHDPKTSFAAGPKKTSPAGAEEKQVEPTTPARPFEPINNDAFGAAAEAALSFCLMSMGFAARRMSGGLQLTLNLARARDLSQVVELQTAYWRQQLDEATAQIEVNQSFIKKFVTSTRSCEDKSLSARRSRSRS